MPTLSAGRQGRQTENSEILKMERIKRFIKTSLLGGLVVVLPVALLAFLITWIYNTAIKIIGPVTNVFMTGSKIPAFFINLSAILFIIFICFAVGIFVRTRLGIWIYKSLENLLLNKIPGYSLIKETVAQFIGKNKSPFASVALVQIFGNDTLLTAFITDKHSDGSYTVFVPTGPNPTSGNIYHLKKEYVHPVDVSVKDAMKSIISCGAGSNKLIDAKNNLRR